MGYYLAIANGEQFPLATISGMKEFREYSLSLPTAEYLELQQLVEHGYHSDYKGVSAQASKAMASPDASDPVKEIIQGLIESIAKAPADCAVIWITDGVNDGLGLGDGAEETAGEE